MINIHSMVMDELNEATGYGEYSPADPSQGLGDWSSSNSKIADRASSESLGEKMNRKIGC